MAGDLKVAIRDLWKSFPLYRTPKERFLAALFPRRARRHWALKGVSLQVASGETVAIVGRNGSGKSTLLKIVTGVLLPDRGEVKRKGRITGLLELGTGFDPERTGRENLWLNGRLLGMSSEELRKKEEAIVAFAELEEAIDRPLRTYSSGMAMRLGFAIALHASPDCFVIDEALSVGDARFQQNCFERLRAFKADGGSILFVSHDLNTVKRLADRALVLERGEAIFEGRPEEAVAVYLQAIAEVEEERLLDRGRGYGSGQVRIEALRLSGTRTRREGIVACGEEAVLEAEVVARETVRDAVFGFMVRDRFGQDLFGTNSWHHDRTFTFEAGRRYRLRVRWRVELKPGRYALTVALHRGPHHLGSCFHWWENAYAFEVAGILGPLFDGICRMPVGAFEPLELVAEGEPKLPRSEPLSMRASGAVSTAHPIHQDRTSDGSERLGIAHPEDLRGGGPARAEAAVPRGRALLAGGGAPRPGAAKTFSGSRPARSRDGTRGSLRRRTALPIVRRATAPQLPPA